MNIALIFAGGTGQRMNTRTLPKQFLELHGKPIIIYTLEVFDRIDEIDAIVVVCVDGWHDYLRRMLKKFGIEKVAAIVGGGATGQDSIRNGIDCIAGRWPGDSIVLIHDGVRPLIDAETIRACIDCARKNGNAVTVAPAVETVTIAGPEPGLVGEIIERKRCSMAKAPQCYRLEDLTRVEARADADGRHDFIDTATMMNHYGYPLYTVTGSQMNIKITNPTDFYIFRAIVDAMENSQIFGL